MSESRTDGAGDGGASLPDELIARYVSGTADPQSVARVEAWIAADPDRRRARIALDQAIARSLEQRVSELPADIGLDRLLRAAATDASARAAARPAARAAHAPETLWARLRRGFAMPQLGMAMAALVLVQSGLIGTLLLDSGGPAPVEYRSVAPGGPRPSVRIAFAPQASEAALRRLLIETGATVIGGPTQLGEYWVQPLSGDLPTLSAQLRASSLVVSAEVDPAGPTPTR